VTVQVEVYVADCVPPGGVQNSLPDEFFTAADAIQEAVAVATGNHAADVESGFSVEAIA